MHLGWNQLMDTVPALAELRKLWDRGVRTERNECSWKEYIGFTEWNKLGGAQGGLMGR